MMNLFSTKKEKGRQPGGRYDRYPDNGHGILGQFDKEGWNLDRKMQFSFKILGWVCVACIAAAALLTVALIALINH